ncbi:hypothetical protein EDD16DRAFT_1517086 [Pisolithus croceorrhizus]|nr:hypothetical protein EDD16DRAFT_1517086 [Pisolithus croceorrhizus]
MVQAAFSAIIILINTMKQPSQGSKQATQKQNRATRVKASVGPSQAPSLQKSAGGEAKWEEPDLPDIPKPHTLFNAAWRKAEKNMQRVQAGQVDPGYHFPKPTLFVNVYRLCQNRRRHISSIGSLHICFGSVKLVFVPPSKFPSPQMWRDFLNTIGMDQPSSTRSASAKSAVWDILGENIIHAAQGFAGVSEEIEWRGMQVQVSSLSDPPLWLICSILWEWSLSPIFGQQTNPDWLVRAFFTASSLESCESGLHANSMEIMLPYWNSFCKLLSVWPGVPPHLWFPAELDGPSGNSTFLEHTMSASLFYVQTAFNFLG